MRFYYRVGKLDVAMANLQILYSHRSRRHRVCSTVQKRRRRKEWKKKNVELAEIEALRITLDNHPDRTTTTTLSRLLCSMRGATRSKGTDESGLLSHSKICEIERYVEEKRS